MDACCLYRTSHSQEYFKSYPVSDNTASDIDSTQTAIGYAQIPIHGFISRAGTYMQLLHGRRQLDLRPKHILPIYPLSPCVHEVKI